MTTSHLKKGTDRRGFCSCGVWYCANA